MKYLEYPKMLVSCRTSRRWSATTVKSEGRKEGGVCARTGKLCDSFELHFMHILFSIVIATIFAWYNCCNFDIRCCDFVLESKRLDFWRKKAMNMDFGA